MKKEDKILKLLLEPEEVKKEFEKCEVEEFFLSVEGKPENYVRERSGRGNHFYNPKAGKMDDFKRACLDIVKNYSNYEEIKKIINNNALEYQVEIDCNFYLPIQKSSSAIDTAAKELGCIVPTGRPDLDNYLKFVLDALHGVFYTDDSKVTKLSAGKYYSMTPRTELTVRIKI